MAAGLPPESWAMLALCGVLPSLVSWLFAAGPSVILMPLLAILLPRLGVPPEATFHIAIATAIAILIPLSIARLGPLSRAERGLIVRVAPAILAGGFFGASLMPSLPGPWLLAGFAIVALLSLFPVPRTITVALAVTPPTRVQGPFAAMLKSVMSSLSGTSLPLSEGGAAGTAAQTLIFALAATAAFLAAPPPCKGCAGFVYLPALIAMGAAAALTAPIARTVFREASGPRPRPLVALASVTALLTVPFNVLGTGRAVLAALTPSMMAWTGPASSTSRSVSEWRTGIK